jgi:AcrR family transcriptional regulator
MAAVSSASRPIGRPRRLDPEAERAQILRAANVVMRRTGFAKANLAEILSVAGLSTGSFYRHFSSKDHLLLEMYRENAAQAAERIDQRVRRSDSCIEGLREWIDEVLSFGYDPAKSRRVALMGSQAARQAEGYTFARHEGSDLLVAPLVRVIEMGKKGGLFPGADPVNDARAVYAMTFALVDRAVAGRAVLDRDEALDQVLRFCLPALQGHAAQAGAKRRAR